MTVFNLEQSIYSLLTNPDLMKDDNLVFFDEDDPTKLPNVDHTSTQIDEFVHRSRFRDAANEVCKGPNDVALPLCIFIDNHIAIPKVENYHLNQSNSHLPIFVIPLEINHIHGGLLVSFPTQLTYPKQLPTKMQWIITVF